MATIDLTNPYRIDVPQKWDNVKEGALAIGCALAAIILVGSVLIVLAYKGYDVGPINSWVSPDPIAIYSSFAASLALCVLVTGLVITHVRDTVTRSYSPDEMNEMGLTKHFTTQVTQKLRSDEYLTDSYVAKDGKIAYIVAIRRQNEGIIRAFREMAHRDHFVKVVCTPPLKDSQQCLESSISQDVLGRLAGPGSNIIPKTDQEYNISKSSQDGVFAIYLKNTQYYFKTKEARDARVSDFAHLTNAEDVYLEISRKKPQKMSECSYQTVDIDVNDKPIFVLYYTGLNDTEVKNDHFFNENERNQKIYQLKQEGNYSDQLEIDREDAKDPENRASNLLKISGEKKKGLDASENKAAPPVDESNRLQKAKIERTIDQAINDQENQHPNPFGTYATLDVALEGTTHYVVYYKDENNQIKSLNFATEDERSQEIERLKQNFLSVREFEEELSRQTKAFPAVLENENDYWTDLFKIGNFVYHTLFIMEKGSIQKYPFSSIDKLEEYIGTKEQTQNINQLLYHQAQQQDEEFEKRLIVLENSLLSKEYAFVTVPTANPKCDKITIVCIKDTQPVYYITFESHGAICDAINGLGFKSAYDRMKPQKEFAELAINSYVASLANNPDSSQNTNGYYFVWKYRNSSTEYIISCVKKEFTSDSITREEDKLAIVNGKKDIGKEWRELDFTAEETQFLTGYVTPNETQLEKGQCSTEYALSPLFPFYVLAHQKGEKDEKPELLFFKTPEKREHYMATLNGSKDEETT